jgi:small conductance mechanosensitive channel
MLLIDIEFYASLPWYIQSAIKIGIVVVIAIIVERLATRYLRRFIKRVEWPPQIEGALIPITRFAIILAVVMIIMEIGGLPSAWFTAFMGLGGAAIGFASTRSIGNFIAGLYILASHPFTVGDYIRIDKFEGIVKEITINYTKLLTPSGNIILMNNQEILGKNIINFRVDEESDIRYCYSFEVGFDHSVPVDRLHEIFDDVISKYSGVLPKKPEYTALSMDRSEKKYIFYMYFNDPEDIFVIQPKFLDEIMTAWDDARLKFV